MKPEVQDFPLEEACAAGIVGPLRLEDVLFISGKANGIAPLQVLRADRVAGPDHVRTAAAHAHRAFREGRNHADRLEVEFTRYLAGERQIRAALKKMGVEDGQGAGVVVGLGPKRLDAVQYYLHASGARTDARLLDASEEKVRGFGVSQAQWDATPAPNRLDLVLEAVAAVDLWR